MKDTCDKTIVYVDRGSDRPPWPCGYRNGGRFAAERLRPPASDAVAQTPRHGDDVPVSATTGRFSLYENGHRVDSDVDWKSVAKILAEFGNVSPTVGDLRRALASRMGTRSQIELRQRPKDAPEKDRVEGPRTPIGKDAAVGS